MYVIEHRNDYGFVEQLDDPANINQRPRERYYEYL